MASIEKTYTLQREDGTEVTAQEVYDAFVSGPIWLTVRDGELMAVTGFVWRNSDGTAVDATAVAAVALIVDKETIIVGDKSIIEGTVS